MEEKDSVLEELRSLTASNIKKDIEKCLEKYKNACLSLKMGIELSGGLNVVHYSGNGRRNNKPITIAEVHVCYKIKDVVNWND